MPSPLHISGQFWFVNITWVRVSLGWNRAESHDTDAFQHQWTSIGGMLGPLAHVMLTARAWKSDCCLDGGIHPAMRLIRHPQGIHHGATHQPQWTDE